MNPVSSSKKILITSAGGTPAVNFVRSLKLSPEKFYFIGTDCNKFYLQRAETDKKYLVPQAADSDFIVVLKDIIKETGAEFIHTQNDVEIGVISKNREKFSIKSFLPSKKTVALCQNKLATSKIWMKGKLPQPKSLPINNENDLKNAFRALGNRIWIRNVEGASGRGSLLVDKYKIAKSWIDFKDGWGHFMAAEYLSPQSITWQSLWNKGKLIIAQSRKRIYWEFADRAPSGITGITGTGVTVSDRNLDRIAKEAILAIDENPHGIFSVDLTYDKDNVPNPTEINIGRFFTTHEFFARAGLNMPYIYVKIAFGEKYPKPVKTINPLPQGLAWIRGMDFKPILTTTKEIDRYEKELAERRKKLNL